jgi:aspartyl-tRNA(Asn)/glutamyl-tRNA(Gln) amidotransferase subunit A
MMDKWLGRSAADLGRAIDAGKINPVDLTEAFLDAIARHPDAKRIYARTTADRARSTAVSAVGRARAGTRIGPLDGVPLSWKDNFDAAGVPCEAGSALLKGRVPDTDAELLHGATTQGLVCLGKTHMTELAFSGLGLNPVTATPPCINFPDAVPGGSSSGAAASVAFGLAPAAIGSDTGGSVRVPAAWNDLVGLKTTHGRLSTKGVVPLCDRFDTVGPLATTVEDCALILSVLSARRVADLNGASLTNARFGVLKTVALDDLRDAPPLTSSMPRKWPRRCGWLPICSRPKPMQSGARPSRRRQTKCSPRCWSVSGPVLRSRRQPISRPGGGWRICARSGSAGLAVSMPC